MQPTERRAEPAAAVAAPAALLPRPAAAVWAVRLALPVFAAAVFLNAGLLFLVQPLFSRMVLPRLGGTAAVWNTCLLFFQTALLLGYLYAHLSLRWLGGRRQAALHLALLALAAATLPIAVPAGWTPPAGGWPVGWLLLLLTVSLGLPFVLLSAGGPMLQAWFARADHAAARDPYFLYSASNLGSMAGLLAYPLLFEPLLPLAGQSRAWAAGYALLLVLLLACALMVRRAQLPTATVNAPAAGEADAGTSSALERVRWVALALVPSSLLLGVTSFLTTDIAAMPLLWVVPLALYLLSFVIAFARRPPLPHRLVVRLHAHALILLAVLLFWGIHAWPLAMMPLHLLAFFLTALLCHGELARRRPGASRLTEFYLLLALGGALGGAFTVLVAPFLFRGVVEYPLMLVAACLLRPGPAGGRRFVRGDVALPLLLGAGLVLLLRLGPSLELASLGVLAATLSALIAIAALRFSTRPLRFGLAIGLVLLAGVLGRPAPTELLHAERTFYGVHRVRLDAAAALHTLMHGTTLHGAQSLRAADRLEPLTYYHRDGPLGQLFAMRRQNGGAARVGVVGLGTGSMACHGGHGDRWTFFEIDAAVERIARNPRYFTFLRDCPPATDVVLGDARLTLRDHPGRFDVLVLDAFSSDAIPMHLMTREALALYRARLAPGGVIAFHVSNRHLRLAPVLAALARDAQMAALYRDDAGMGDPGEHRRTGSAWAVLADDAATLGPLARAGDWHPLPEPRPGTLWTDDYANVLRVIRWR